MYRKTQLARSVAAALGVASVGVGMAPPAFAQSNSTGSIYGQNGNPAGTGVVVENSDTGLKRTAKPDASGRHGKF